jgi:intein/homing endonuclease
LINRIKTLSIEKLDDLAETLLEFSEVADLVTWLEQQEI